MMREQHMADPGVRSQLCQRCIAGVARRGLHAAPVDLHDHTAAVAARLQQARQPMRLKPPGIGIGLQAMVNMKTVQRDAQAPGGMGGMPGQHGGIGARTECHANSRPPRMGGERIPDSLQQAGIKRLVPQAGCSVWHAVLARVLEAAVRGDALQTTAQEFVYIETGELAQ